MAARRISWRRFTWIKTSQGFFTELSDLRGWNPGDPIQLEGKRETVTYDYSTTVWSPDDEIVGWELRPSLEETKRVPGCRGTKVVIYND
jgi:hypothetical protein